MLFFRNYRRLCVYVDNIKRIKYHKVVMCISIYKGVMCKLIRPEG